MITTTNRKSISYSYKAIGDARKIRNKYVGCGNHFKKNSRSKL